MEVQSSSDTFKQLTKQAFGRFDSIQKALADEPRLREAAKLGFGRALAPVGQLLVETDAPYMTPEPYRGARNEPALIGHTAKVVAQARGMEVADVAREIAETFSRVYGV